MDFEAGDIVERRHGRDDSRFGRVQMRCHPGYDGFYVTVGIGMTHIDHARDLRLADHARDRVLANLGYESEAENKAIRTFLLP